MRSKLSEDITYWATDGYNDFGEPAFAAPVKFVGRWEDRNEQVRLPTGQEVVSKSVVFVPGDFDVVIGARLAKGDHSGEADPTVVDAREIQTVLEVPSMRTNELERRVIL